MEGADQASPKNYLKLQTEFIIEASDLLHLRTFDSKTAQKNNKTSRPFGYQIKPINLKYFIEKPKVKID